TELRKTVAELWSEMNLARKIQTVLLPASPRVVEYDVAATSRPAASVGGDYYDIFRAGDTDWVLIGDVSGHGVPAGLIMMMVQTAVRATVGSLQARGEALSPARMLAHVNRAIFGNLHAIGRGQYMTMTALCVQSGRVRYAGLHQDLLVYRASTRSV